MEEALFGSIFNATQVGMLLADYDGVWLAANPVLCAALKLKAEDLIGRAHPELFPPDARPVLNKMRLELARRGSWRGEVALLGADGERITFDWRVSILSETKTVFAIALDSTERRAAESAIRRSEERYRAIVEGQSEMVCRFRIDGTILFANGAYARARGTVPDALVGTNFWDFIEEKDRLPVKRMLKGLSREEPEVRIENRFETTDGVRWTLWANRVLRFDRQGNGIEFQSAGIDITDRKRTEEALANSRARLQAVLDVLPLPLFIADAEGELSPANSAARESWSPEAGSSKAQASRYGIDRVLAGGEIITAEEVEIPTPNGPPRTVLNYARPIRDVEGRIAGAVSVNVDITERKETLQALQKSSARERAFLDHLPVGVWFINEHEQLSYVNAAGNEIWSDNGKPGNGELSQYKTWRRGSEEILGREEWAVRRAIKYGEITLNEELEIEDFSGKRKTILNSAVPVRDAEQRIIGAVVFNQDITEQKNTEEALKEADRRKDEFLATLAHELRNPLAPLSAGLELLKMSELSAETTEDVHRTMQRQVAQLVRLIDDLMDVSRITRGKLRLKREAVEVADVVKDAVAATRPFIEQARHTLTVTLPPEPITLHADSDRLTQVLANLLNNAAKYTPEGGEILLKAERREQDVVISVKDTGVGIPPEMSEHIFDMFTQIEGRPGKGVSGLGIGLTLVKSLVEMHDGRVTVHSEEGSEFSVVLPIQRKGGEVRKDQSLSRIARSGPERLVLIVDDNHTAADMLARLISLLGHNAKTANDGEEALRLAAEFKPDIVLLDLGMPFMDGFEVARRIRNEPWGTEMTLVALTGWGQEEDKKRTKEAGFDGHIVKPADHETLVAMLAAPERINSY